MSNILSLIEQNSEAEGGSFDDLVKLSYAIFQSESPPKAEGVYVFAQTEDNESSSFDAVCELLGGGAADRVLIVDGACANGFPGYEQWRYRLGQRIGVENIAAVPIGNRYGVNTLSESEALVRYATKEGMSSLYVVTVPFHLLRAFMTAASVSIRENADLGLYPHAGTDQSLDKVVLHSQGVVKGTRLELFMRELNNIRSYQAKGDLEPTGRVSDYLNKHPTRLKTPSG